MGVKNRFEMGIRMKKKMKLFAASAVLVCAIYVILAAGWNGQKKAEPEFVFSYAENQPEDYPTTLGAKYFAKLVEERTGGKIRILVKAEAEMGTEAEVIEQLKYGGIDFARVSLSQLSECIPQLNVLQMPYLYRNSEHMWNVLDGEIGDGFIEIVQEYDLVGLSWYDAGARSFYNSLKPITCLEDMKGMRIRVQESELMADIVKALGAEPRKIAYGEVYASLERGTVDGAENNWPSYVSMQHNEVAGYWTADEHIRIPEIQLCSKYTWEKLTEEQQQIILESAKESALYERELWTEQERISKEEAIAAGVRAAELSAEEKKRFQNAMKGVYEKYCGDYMRIVDKITAVGNEYE